MAASLRATSSSAALPRSQPQSRPQPRRRVAVAARSGRAFSAAGGAAALAVSLALAAQPALAAPVTDASGTYSDPIHPGCFRTVDARAGKVSGVDGTPACGPDAKLTEWELGATFAEGKGGDVTLLVDFSPKGGPKNLEGKYAKGRISWPDGNSWTKQ